MHTVALLIARCALARKESRGAHFRSDYPMKMRSPAIRLKRTMSQVSLRRRGRPLMVGAERARIVTAPVFALLALAAVPIQELSPWAVFWTAPAILLAAMLIAWAAESAQFFVAQGFALAILAWLQTLPEFAVEAVLAWKQQVHLLTANLTGALRLLTGLGWPMIYFTAAIFHRLKYKRALKEIQLEKEHSVEVVGLLVPLMYANDVLGIIINGAQREALPFDIEAPCAHTPVLLNTQLSRHGMKILKIFRLHFGKITGAEPGFGGTFLSAHLTGECVRLKSIGDHTCIVLVYVGGIVLLCDRD